MESGGIYGLIGILLGYLLRPVDEWVRGRREKAQRRVDFQRDTLLALQDALFDADRFAGQVAHRGVRSAGDPEPRAAFQDATNRVSKYRVRVADQELVDAVLKFYGAAMQEATGMAAGNLLPVIETKQANLTRANERIGVLLKALH